MFRRITVLSILASAAVSSTALADFFFEVQETTVAVPASGSTDFLVPVHLVSDAPGSDLPKLLETVQAVFDIGFVPGLTFNTDEVGETAAIEVLPLEIFVTSLPPALTIPNADLGVLSFIFTDPPVEISASPVHLFDLSFTVAAGTSPGTVPVSFVPPQPPAQPMGTPIDLNLVEFAGEASARGIGASPASGNIILTAVPEPSEWILGFLMTGLLGTIASKRFFAKKQVAETK